MVEKSGFTPGPWEFAGGDSAPILHIYAPDHKHLYHGDRPLDEQEANARLMASAPELLESLQSLHAFVGVMVGSGPDATIPETIPTPIGVPVKIGAIMRDAAAAISKALGEPHA